MPAFMLCLNELDCFLLTDSSTGMGMLVQNEIHEWLTYNQTHLSRLAWILSSMTTRAFVHNNIGGCFEHEIPVRWKRDDLFQITPGNVFVYSDYGP